LESSCYTHNAVRNALTSHLNWAIGTAVAGGGGVGQPGGRTAVDRCPYKCTHLPARGAYIQALSSDGDSRDTELRRQWCISPLSHSCWSDHETFFYCSRRPTA